MSPLIPLRDPNEDYNIKRFYNCVCAQTISTSGKFLFAGNRAGDIFVQNITNFQNSEEMRPPLKIYPQGEECEINCLSFHREFLIVGSIGVVYGLKWVEDKAELATGRAWEIKIPIDVEAIEVPDVNYMWLRPETDLLYVGCGDNVIYELNLEDGRITRSFKGHEDYIHGVCGSGTDKLYSASEDGSIRMWVTNQKESTGLIEPYKKDTLVRPEMGKWQGALATNDDWLLCGGGPKLSLWHLRSMECTSVFPFPGKVHVCDFVEDMIFVGGEHTNAQFYAMNGKLRADIKTENTAVYSAVWKTEPERFMSIAGYSNWLSILNDFRFLDSKIELYESRSNSDTTTVKGENGV
ncbi:THO complex subunit 6 [Musca domestica]|uniref:THO complex subunit 6 n=1 Tax=Musca domestica TaxID=7370 RepID=A0A1I8NF05_MUSDO|nr:THO complex subunit 6 [Musca domestica]